MARVLKPGGALGFTDNRSRRRNRRRGTSITLKSLRDPSHNWCYPLVRLADWFESAGLKVEHSEESPKPLDFEEWSNRMGCTEETKKELKRLLDSAPPEAKEFFNPRIEDGRPKFSIRESNPHRGQALEKVARKCLIAHC